MKRLFAAAALLATVSQVALAGELTLFVDSDFRGGHISVQHEVRDLNEFGFNDRASSMVVRSGVWQLCENRDFGGFCAEFGPGEYRTLPRFNDSISSLREIDRDRDRDHGRDGPRGDRDGDRGEWRGRRGGDGVQLFAGPGFHGDQVAIGSDVRSMEQVGFNDRTSSLIIRDGRWEFCEHADFRGECVVLGPGEYGSLDRMNNRISSMRRVR